MVLSQRAGVLARLDERVSRKSRGRGCWLPASGKSKWHHLPGQEGPTGSSFGQRMSAVSVIMISEAFVVRKGRRHLRG